MKKISIFALSILLSFPAIAETAPADAETADLAQSNPDIHLPHGLQMGLGVSATSGLNGFVGYVNKKFDSFWWKRLGVRFDFATTAPIKSSVDSVLDSAIGSDGIDIGDDITLKDVAAKAKHMAALIDIYPFGDTWFLGGWRLTGGYYIGNLKATANLTGQLDGVPDKSFAFELAGTQYRYNGNSVHGTAYSDWKYRGPYVGTGFDLGLFAGIKIYMDAGVVFTNRAAQLNLDVPLDNLETRIGDSWVAVNTPALEQALNDAKTSALADARDTLNDYKFYPMVKLGVMYRF